MYTCMKSYDSTTEAVVTDVPEEAVDSKGEAQKPSVPAPTKGKSISLRKLSFLRSKSHINSNPRFTWKVLKEDLIKKMQHRELHKKITRSARLELDAGHGKHNPKLTFQLFPYGLHRDEGKAVTMVVRIATPDKCPPLPLSSEMKLTVVVFEGEENELMKCDPVVEKLSTISTCYVYSAITHDQVKESRSKFFLLEVAVLCTGL